MHTYLYSAYTCVVQESLLENGAYHSGHVFPLQLKSMRQSLIEMLTGQPDPNNSSFRRSCQVIQNCVKVAIQTNHHAC